MTVKEIRGIPQVIDNTEIIFESVSKSPGRYRTARASKWDTRQVTVFDAENLPIVGAQIEYGEHETTQIAQGELPQSSENGYRLELLETTDGLDNFFRYPVLVTTSEQGSDRLPSKESNQLDAGVIVWMTAMETAALLPKVPIRVAPSVLEDLKSRYQELYEKMVDLHTQTNKEQNGDILNSAISSEVFTAEAQQKAFKIYQERLELSRMAYGIWIKATQENDTEQLEQIKQLLMESLQIAPPFSGISHVSDLVTKVRTLSRENQETRVQEDIGMSSLFGVDVKMLPVSPLITEVYGYELSEWIRKGLFAELMGLELCEATQRVLQNVNTSVENSLDVRSASWVSEVFYYLTKVIFVGIPIERAAKILQPLWDIIVSKFTEFGLETELEKIKSELGTGMPELAEELTGESFL